MTDTWSLDQARWVFRRAGTLALAGAEPVGEMVLPNGTFFPDRFDGSPESIGTLFERMLGHVGLSDVPNELLIVDPEEGRVVSSCSSGGCGTSAPAVMSGERVTADGDGYRVMVATPELQNRTVLTTVLARAVGHLFLLEADAMSAFAKPERAPAADLAATMLGLGVLVANGSGIEVKGCGGMKVHQATSLSAGEAALGLAIALEREALRKQDAAGKQAALDAARAVAGALDPVARTMFGPARMFVRAQQSVVRRLDDAPAAIERGDFALRDPSELGVGRRLLRVVGLDKMLGKAEDDDPIQALERELASGAPKQRASTQSAEKRAKMAELRAMVDETLGDR
jgi:hypothetical protein